MAAVIFKGQRAKLLPANGLEFKTGQGLDRSGNHDLTLTTTANTSVILPTTGILGVNDNIGVECSVGSSALTIALKTSSGADPSSSSPVSIKFRSSTASSGQSVVRQVTGALSTVVSSGSTLGHKNSRTNWIWVYAIDNAGTVELAYSSTKYPDNTIQSTTAEGGAGGADSFSTLYSTTARSNVAIKFLARIRSNQTSTGTWATTPSEVAVGDSALVTRPIHGSWTVSGTQNAANDPILFGNTVSDDLSIYSSGNVTVPDPGIYVIVASTQAQDVLTTAQTHSTRINHSGVHVVTGQIGKGSGAGLAPGSIASDTRRLQGGDVVKITTNATSTNILGAATEGYFQITKISD